ncbi:MAG: sulfotransferase domain-containing protein [Planctomycetota bacterium]
MKPDFICIGAQKAGTSWLYERLSEHPAFSMLPVKELHYFDRSTEYQTLDFLAKTRLIDRLKEPKYAARAVKRILRSRDRQEARWWARFYFSNYSDRWYKSLFARTTGLTGDITPGYAILESEDVTRLHAVAPDAKIVLMLRNPIDRAWSMFRFMAKRGGPTDLNDYSLFQAFVTAPAQTLRSDYIRTIDLYRKHFDSSAMLIGFYDAIAEQPGTLFSAITRYLGADEAGDTINLRQVTNRSLQADMPHAHHAFLIEMYRGVVEELADRYGGYAARWAASISGPTDEGTGSASLPTPVTYA